MPFKVEKMQDVAIVLKACPMVPVINPETRFPEQVLHVMSGTVETIENGVLTMSSESTDGERVEWQIKEDELLMLGIKSRVGTR